MSESLTLQQIADRIDPAKAQLACATIMACLGSRVDWPSDAVEWCAGAVSDATRDLDLPSFLDQADHAIGFWLGVLG